MRDWTNLLKSLKPKEKKVEENRMLRQNVWKRIVIHHSAAVDSFEGVDAERYKAYHVESLGWSDIGYHFVFEQVDGNYQLLAGRPLNRSGAHCPGWNDDGIGICVAGNFQENPPSREALGSLARYVAGLMDAFQMDDSELRYHGEAKATDCPGKAFVEFFEVFRQMVLSRRA